MCVGVGAGGVRVRVRVRVRVCVRVCARVCQSEQLFMAPAEDKVMEFMNWTISFQSQLKFKLFRLFSKSSINCGCIIS